MLLKKFFLSLFAIFTSLCAICYPTNPARAAVTTEDLKPKPNEVVATFAGGCFWCLEANSQAPLRTN